MNGVLLRRATEADAAALLEIYAPYVRETAITFEYEPPAIEEFRARMRAVLAEYPYLAAEAQGRILGYAYATPYRTRAAYDWCAETTVYIDQSARHMGLGRLLYEKLLEILTRQGVTNAYACITFPNEPSIAFHQRLGFETIGHFTRCGYKSGRWWDMIWMEKFLRGHETPPKPRRPIAEVFAEMGF